MLRLQESFIGKSVLSIRVGQPIATIEQPIINPNNLYVEGWHVNVDKVKNNLILQSNDIREIAPQGFIVNDYEVLSAPAELVRLKDILELNFNLTGLKVVSENDTNYGKVNDFAINTDNFFIQKIYSSQSIIKSLNSNSLSIDRSQIVEITDKKIVISDPIDRAPARTPQPA